MFNDFGTRLHGFLSMVEGRQAFPVHADAEIARRARFNGMLLQLQFA